MMFPPLLFIALVILAGLAHITADLYVPSLSFIVLDLKTTTHLVQFSLALFLFGFGFSHLFYGPISDSLGRRKPILWGIGLSIIGSLICFLAPSIEVLLIGRLLQGCGVGATTSVGQSVMRDLFAGEQLAKIGSLLGTVMVIVTASSPILGGYIQHFFSWRMHFLLLFILTVIAWLFIWKTLPETHRSMNSEARRMHTILKNYGVLLLNKTFMGYALCMSLAYSSVLVYLATSPFILQSQIGLTPVQFGWVQLIVDAAIFLSSLINSQIILTKGITKMIMVGIAFMLFGSLSMLIFAWFGWINIFVVMFPVFLCCMGAGFIAANAYAGALHPFPNISGSASALFGCLQIVIASLLTAIIASVSAANQMPLAFMLFIIAIFLILSVKFLVLAK